MRLPLLSFTADLYPDIDFSNIAIIACQHILGTTLDLFEELFRKGLKPDNIFLIGKCYSTHLGTLKKFENLGVHISSLSTAFDTSRSYDEQFEEYVREFVNQALSAPQLKNVEKILILDDGGFVIRSVNEMASDTADFVGIEQTSSGYEKLKTTKLRFPVINVARSRAKLEIESPMIAKKVIEKMMENIGLSKETRVLVVGQGSVGRNIKLQLNGISTVNGCDVVADRCDFGGKYSDQLPTFDLIIGATGKLILTAQECQKLKAGAVLISASSSDREFPALVFRKKTRSKKCHKNLELNGVRLLNNGFPINFDGTKHSLPPKEAQLTRALLLAGLFEAISKNRSPGLHELSDKQDAITEEFNRIHNPIPELDSL